jgi:putative colanic acid biosynthesis acetyltransferase WcaF
MHSTTDLSNYEPTLQIGAGKLKLLLWYITNCIFFKSGFLFPNAIKCFLLRSYGARVGNGVVIKPYVNIKNPWKLVIGNYCWIGENVWIDNLDWVKMGNHVCLSQGAMLLTGNHNYKSANFDLITKEIVLKDGVWIGAKSVVCPGVRCHSHAVLSVGSVASADLEAYSIYRGNPAILIKQRDIE